MPGGMIPRMSNSFSSCFRHQAWADAALLTAVHTHHVSLEDPWLLKTLCHILFVQRFFLSRFTGRDFNMAEESKPPASFAELVSLYKSTHTEELAFIEALTPADLERRFELAFLQTEFAVADGLMQVVFHSQHHRGQCLTRLRENGATPPTLDYILWAKDRPEASWPVL
jgi:uncharacterized damage-inducible protein DinB